MAVSVSEMLAQMKTDLVDRLGPWLFDMVCKMPIGMQANFDRVLLAGIYLKLAEIARGSTFGSNYMRITPVTLGTSPVKILERDTRNLVRKVTVWVDSSVGGPSPTIRVSASGDGAGMRINAGSSNVIGEVPPNQELWASSSTAIQAYVVEVG